MHSNPFVYHTMLYYYSTITLLLRLVLYVIHASYHSPLTSQMSPNDTCDIFLSLKERDRESGLGTVVYQSRMFWLFYLFFGVVHSVS